jgi:SPRY domain-containing SOCS box protein 3
MSASAQHVDYGLLDDNYHHRAPPFCNCSSAESCSDFRYIRNAQVSGGCKCGEDATDKMEWTWDDKQLHPSTEINGPNVVFHPIYSQGSSIIRGAKPLEFGMHHYWEIKIVSCLSGTDVVSRNIYLN